MTQNTFYKLITLVIFSTTLSACGGGGSDTPATSNEQITNPTIPVDTTLNWNDDNWNTSDWK